MDWNRNPKQTCLAWLVAMILICNFQKSHAQQDTVNGAATSAPVWSDEQWKNATRDINYTPEEEKKEDEKEDAIDTEEKYDGNDINFSKWLNDVLTSPLARLISILFIISILVWLILRIGTTRKQAGIEKIVPLAEGLPDDVDEKLPETELEKYLRMAIEKGDHKTAVRILYLMLIQHLNTLEWIHWKKNKTNSDYLNEMRSRHQYNRFRDLTLIYEIVWYGDKTISSTEFQAVNSAFAEYHKSTREEVEKK